MGKTLRYAEPELQALEQDVYDVLRRQGRIPQGSLATLEDFMTPAVLQNRAVMRLALWYALKHECPDLVPIEAGTDEERWQKINNLMDAAVEAGIDNLELKRLISEAYLLATSPSTVASVKSSWQLLDERQKAEQEAMQMDQENSLKKAEDRLARAKEILEAAKKEEEKAKKSQEPSSSPPSA